MKAKRECHFFTYEWGMMKLSDTHYWVEYEEVGTHELVDVKGIWTIALIIQSCVF